MNALDVNFQSKAALFDAISAQSRDISFLFSSPDVATDEVRPEKQFDRRTLHLSPFR